MSEFFPTVACYFVLPLGRQPSIPSQRSDASPLVGCRRRIHLLTVSAFCCLVHNLTTEGPQPDCLLLSGRNATAGCNPAGAGITAPPSLLLRETARLLAFVGYSTELLLNSTILHLRQGVSPAASSRR